MILPKTLSGAAADAGPAGGEHHAERGVTALRGRGERLGGNLVPARDYLREFTPSCPPCSVASSHLAREGVPDLRLYQEFSPQFPCLSRPAAHAPQDQGGSSASAAAFERVGFGRAVAPALGMAPGDGPDVAVLLLGPLAGGAGRS